MTTAVYFEDIKTHILAHIHSAHQSVKLAVSWLTDKEIFNLLLAKVSKGVQVSLVTRNDYLNNHPEALDWNEFVAIGAKLYFSRNGEQLHYKFILVDDVKVLCTSYNLTCFANGNNRENAMIFTGQEMVSQFVTEFDYLTTTLPLQTDIPRIHLKDVPEALHGFYTITIKSDGEKQEKN